MYNKHLDAFMSVVEKGSFSKAAEREGRYPHHWLRLLQQRNHSLRYTTVGELHMFVEKVGISEMDTIIAATSNGAKVLRVYDKTGSLEAGKSADLLVINGSVYTFAWGQFVAGILMNIIRCQIWKFTMPTTGVIDTPLVLVLAYQLIFGTMISYCIYLVGVTMIGPSRAICSLPSSLLPPQSSRLCCLQLRWCSWTMSALCSSPSASSSLRYPPRRNLYLLRLSRRTAKRNTTYYFHSLSRGAVIPAAAVFLNAAM